MNRKQPSERALDLLGRLVHYGTWYSSCIELDTYSRFNGALVDGGKLHIEALDILLDAGRSTEAAGDSQPTQPTRHGSPYPPEAADRSSASAASDEQG